MLLLLESVQHLPPHADYKKPCLRFPDAHTIDKFAAKGLEFPFVSSVRFMDDALCMLL